MTAIEATNSAKEYILRGINSLWLALTLTETDAFAERDGRVYERKSSPGSIVVNPNGPGSSVQMLIPGTTLHLFLHNDIVTRVADQIYGRPFSDLELLFAFGDADPALHHLLQTARHHLDQPDHAAWTVDYLSRAIAAHVLSKYASQRKYAPTQESMAELSGAQLQRVEEFLQGNLDGNFKFEQLGASVGLSRTLFFERFKRTKNLSPNQYLQLLRVERAKQLLRDDRLPMAEIALISGFPDQAYMTRVFGRVTGTTPGRYRADHN